jgi:hypothetical protein
MRSNFSRGQSGGRDIVQKGEMAPATAESYG